MVNLLLAIISSSLVSIVMRAGENCVKNNISMLSVNYLICMILSVIYTGLGNLMQSGEGMITAVSLGSINGFFYIASLLLFQNSVRKNGVVLSGIFMKLGIMMPLAISLLVFKEKPAVDQIIGFFLAMIAIVMINMKEKSKEKTEFKFGLILVLIGCGMADGMSKIYQELGPDAFEELFLVVTFAVAFILSFVLVKIKKQRYTKFELVYGMLLGVPNYYSARFLLKALGEVAAVVAYPTFSIGTIAIITLTGMLAFKEKITKLQMTAIGVIAIAVVLLN